MARPGRVDFSSPTANMYGCEPCPKCKSGFRAGYRSPPRIACDDCGFEEAAIFVEDGEEEPEKFLKVDEGSFHK